jgi:hypothetical protein
MAMMICVALGGGGVTDEVVSVLCGAGGGLTVHPPSNNAGTDTSAPSLAQDWRVRFGTPLRVSAVRRAAAHPHFVGVMKSDHGRTSVFTGPMREHAKT